VGTGLYGNWITSRVLQENALDNATNETTLQVEQITAFLNNAQEDILLLSELGSLQALIEARTQSAPAIATWRNQVQQDFSAFSRRRGIYYQIRYILETGQEFIRIDSIDGEIRVIPFDSLQDKSSRYYFQDTMALNRGQIFVSPLDLNREFGEIEVPYKPVIRYATPVFDSGGARRGIVITNIYADKFLDVIRQASDGTKNLLLVDQDGYYLVNPDKTLEWGGPNDLNSGAALQDAQPDAAAEILSGQPGQFITEKALVYIPVYPNPNNPTTFWVIIHEEPVDTIFAAVWNFRVAAASILVLAAAIATAMALVLARSLTAPIRNLRQSVIKFSRGELTEMVPITSNDEIGELSETFNEMAVALDRSRTQRQNLLERLINVQEEERRMVAYDIHDGLIQRLVGARLQLGNFISQRRHTEAPPAEQALERGATHLSSAIVEGRRLIEGLRPAMLDDLGLAPALHELAEQVAAEMNCRLEFSSDLSDDRRLPAPLETTAFRIVQEALSNSRKYSQSDRLQVQLSQANQHLELTVRDWGVGFDTGCMFDQDHRCIGLASMQERANLVGGRCTIISKPGHGTTIQSKLPLEQ